MLGITLGLAEVLRGVRALRGTGILLEARSGHTRGEVGAPAQADIPDSARSDEGRVTGSRSWQSLRAVLDFVSIRPYYLLRGGKPRFWR